MLRWEENELMLELYSGQVWVGRIGLNRQDGPFSWAVYYEGGRYGGKAGDADTLEAAKAAAESAFREWLDRVGLVPRGAISFPSTLPCDVKLPGVTLRRGVSINTLFTALDRRLGLPDDQTRFFTREEAEGNRQALLDAMSGNAIPAGWKLVPVEPTDAMLNAGVLAHEIGKTVDVWEAMLAAAPKPGEAP